MLVPDSFLSFLKTIDCIYQQSCCLRERVWFQVGEKHSLLLSAVDDKTWQKIFQKIHTEGIEYFILGEGSNILLTDKNTHKIALYTPGFNQIAIYPEQEELIIDSGASVGNVIQHAYHYGLSGLEFMYGMPGTIGGAVWMNARCYGQEIFDILKRVDYINEKGDICSLYPEKKDFAYKHSPFQNMKAFILRAHFSVKSHPRHLIKEKMDAHLQDRINKGHYYYPCAGSIFKNNIAFGAPVGKIVDSLGLKGLRYHQAQIAPWHGNIIINLDKAHYSDIIYLIEKIKETVFQKKNFQLEEEIIII